MNSFALTRRRLLGALGAVSLTARGMFVGDGKAAPAPSVAGLSCVLSPAMTEGPFFIDERLNRSDLTSGTAKAGVVQGLPLLLHIDLRSVQATGCLPVAGMQVDVWHADAMGDYSGVSEGAGRSGKLGNAFLRGYQVSDASGRVTFRTIYPGWYYGRTVHIHVKARLFNAAGSATYDFASQLFFDDESNDRVMALAPYNARGARSVRNDRDGILRGGTSALVNLTAPADGARGYVATATLGLKLAVPGGAAIEGTPFGGKPA
ncbi:MAG TPA: intradiol ring-cleavage dioxygenase [Casimicrobiaceae bacterium]|nr:intradiol ring-cleavage dioxygenase [Casimicrobiaceae bacterium]